jgi:hypothetical protein
MPVLAFLATVGLAIVPLLFVADANRESVAPSGDAVLRCKRLLLTQGLH